MLSLSKNCRSKDKKMGAFAPDIRLLIGL